MIEWENSGNCMKIVSTLIKIIFKNIINPITITFFILAVETFLLFTKGNRNLGLNYDQIVILLGTSIAFAGYFLAHFLEIQRKQREERLQYYRELVGKIRVFIKEMDDKRKLGEDFDEAYYTSWMSISSNVYKKLVEYLEAYKNWNTRGKTEPLKETLGDKIKELMKAMRREFIIDDEVEFQDYDFRWNKEKDKI